MIIDTSAENIRLLLLYIID